MRFRFIKFFREQGRTLFVLVVVTLLGFLTKCYGGPGSLWVQNSLGGVLYVVFWSLLFSLFLPVTRPWKICLAVLLTTTALEILQLWHPRLLEAVRSTFLGHALLGNTFSWLDMLHYLAGFLLSLLLVRLCR